MQASNGDERNHILATRLRIEEDDLRDLSFDALDEMLDGFGNAWSVDFFLHFLSRLAGDVSAATDILDRFLHHAEIIQSTGRSYRLKDRATGKTDVDN